MHGGVVNRHGLRRMLKLVSLVVCLLVLGFNLPLTSRYGKEK